MARSFRESRFRSRKEVGEDVNPSAYIVNLADCMLVLACGFMVALMAFWNIDLSSVEDVEASDLEEVQPEDAESEIQNGGSSYVQAGTAYRDPKTGKVYIVTDEELKSDESSESGQ